MAEINRIPSFCKQEGESILFNQDGELVFYIPEEYFNGRNAEIIGERVMLMGIFNYAVFDKNGKHNGLKTFKLPTTFLCQPGEITKVKQVSLIKEQPVGDYRLLHFRKGDAIIVENPVQDVVNAENFFRLFLITAKFPTTIPYDKLHTYFSKTAKLNGFNFGVNNQMFGILMSEICRDPNNEEIPYRLSGITNKNFYKPIALNMVPKYVSPFASITSENWDLAVVNAIIDKPGKKSPMEPILMG